MVSAMPTPKRLRIPDAAKRLGLSVSSLYRYRHLGTGPASDKIAGVVYYDTDALDAWLASSSERRSTEGRARMSDDDERHGTTNGYTNLGCRCEACRTAWAAYIRAARRRRQSKLATVAVEHGRPSTYANWLCRCGPCTAAHTAADPRRAAS